MLKILRSFSPESYKCILSRPVLSCAVSSPTPRKFENEHDHLIFLEPSGLVDHGLAKGQSIFTSLLPLRIYYTSSSYAWLQGRSLTWMHTERQRRLHRSVVSLDQRPSSHHRCSHHLRVSQSGSKYVAIKNNDIRQICLRLFFYLFD